MENTSEPTGVAKAMRAMTQVTALSLLLGFVCGCSKTAETDYNTLEYRGGLVYVPGSEAPFTGRAVSLFSNKQMKIKVHFEKGLEEGSEVAWYQDGQKESEGTRKKGEWDGVLRHWYPDGKKMAEYTYAGGKLMGRKNWDGKGNPIIPDKKKARGK